MRVLSTQSALGLSWHGGWSPSEQCLLDGTQAPASTWAAQQDLPELYRIATVCALCLVAQVHLLAGRRSALQRAVQVTLSVHCCVDSSNERRVVQGCGTTNWPELRIA